MQEETIENKDMAESGKIISQTEGVPAPAQERASGNTPGQKATLSNRALNRAVADAAEMTDWNNHSGAIRTFTTHFKYNDLTSRLDRIIKEHNRLGHLPAELYDERYEILQEMLNRVRNEYGENVLRKVNSAL